MRTRLCGGAVLAAILLGASASRAPAQAPTFSLDRASVSLLVPPGTNADDLFSPTFPILVLTGMPGANFEVDAFSYQQPFMPKSEIDIIAVSFSVDRAAIGIPGTAVFIETGGVAGSGLAAADIFRTAAPFVFFGTNVQIYDGDGVPTLPNAAPGLGLVEGPAGAGDNLGGLDLKPATSRIYLSVDPVTAGVYGAGASAADVYVANTVPGYDAPAPAIYAPAAALGLVPGDDIDALVVFDNGDGLFQPGLDAVLFSLAPGSPSLGLIAGPGGAATATAGDILQDPFTGGGGLGLPVVVGPAEALGLQTMRAGFLQDDNLDALSMDVVPEPTTIAALISGGIGLGVLGLMWRRRRAKKAHQGDMPESFFQE